MDESFYNKAFKIASIAHEGQKRKNGEDYIKHCQRVADKSATAYMRSVAILHDSLEDGPEFIAEMIKDGLGEGIYKGVDILTRKKEEDYLTYILRVRDSNVKSIKIHDLQDNLNGATGTLKDKYMLAKWILTHAEGC